MVEQIRREIEASVAVKMSLLDSPSILRQVERLVVLCLASLRNGGKIIFAGNGGSFADAQHLAAEFVSRFRFDRNPLASIALGTNNSILSAIGNDYGFDQVFAREFAALARPGDVFVPLSTSGNSPNILAATVLASDLGISTLGMTGLNGGKLVGLCECICVPSADTARIQECHILLGHVLCELVESEFFCTSP